MQPQKTISQDFFSIAGGIAISVFLISVWFCWDAYKIERNDILQSLEANAVKVEHSFDFSIEYSVYVMDYLKKQIENDPEDLKFISNLFTSFQLDPQIRSIFSRKMFSWVNTEGKLIINSDQGILASPADISNRDYLPPTKKNPSQFFIGAPVKGAISQDWILPIALGVTDSKSQYVGTIVFGCNLEKLTALMDQSVLSPNVRYTIINNDGHRIAPFSHTAEQPNAQSKEAIPEGKSGILKDFKFSESDSSWTYYIKSEKYPFVTMVEYDHDATMRRIFYNVAPRIGEFVAFGGFLIYLLYLFYQRIIAPVQHLSIAAEKISRGELNTDIIISGPTEIAQLADGLLQVVKYIDELRLIRQELTRKIRELEEVIAENNHPAP